VPGYSLLYKMRSSIELTRWTSVLDCKHASLSQWSLFHEEDSQTLLLFWISFHMCAYACSSFLRIYALQFYKGVVSYLHAGVH